MIQDNMIGEIQELKLAGFTPKEVHEELRRRHAKVPTLKTVRKYYNMDCVPDDSHAKVRKQLAFDREPFASAIARIVELNPGCYMSSVYDVLVEKFVDTGRFDVLPGNEQTLRNYIHRLQEDGAIGKPDPGRRTYDVIGTPPAGKKAQVDFGQEKCGGGLVVHFMCILLWHSRLLGVYAQDHKFNAEEACRAIHRFFCKCGGRVETLVIDQDSVFVAKEVYGEVFETEVFRAFLSEQDLALWVCNKSDPESKGCVENSVGFVKSSFFSARSFSSIDDVLRSLPRWVERKNRRIRQGTYKVPQAVFEDIEKAALRPLLPSLYEAAPLFLQPIAVNGQPYVLHRAVKYSVPWEMCYTTAYKRVIGAKLHIYDGKRRHVCTHDICDVKGAFIRLDEHRRQPESDWLDTAERMRAKWNCTEFQHFVNGFKKENPERHLGKQLAAVERYLDEKRPDRAFVADVMAACCRDFRYRFTQFKAVFDLMEAQAGSIAPPAVDAAAADVDTRGLESYRAAFDERCAS